MANQKLEKVKKVNNLKNLNLKTVKKENDLNYNKVKTVKFGESTKVDIKQVFKPSILDKLCAEFYNVWLKAYQQKKDTTEKSLIGIGTALILKHFTSLETDAETYDELGELLFDLQDSKYAEPIMSAFDKEQLKVAFDLLGEAASVLLDNVSKEFAKWQEENANKSEVNG